MTPIKLDLQLFNFAGLSAQGTTLSYRVGATGTYTVVPGIQAVPEVGGIPEQLDVTTLDSTKMSYIPGIEDVENLEFTGIYQGSNFQQLKTIEGQQVQWQITYPDRTGFTFTGAGFLTMGSGEVNAPYDFKVTVIVSEGPDYIQSAPAAQSGIEPLAQTMVDEQVTKSSKSNK